MAQNLDALSMSGGDDNYRVIHNWYHHSLLVHHRSVGGSIQSRNNPPDSVYMETMVLAAKIKGVRGNLSHPYIEMICDSQRMSRGQIT